MAQVVRRLPLVRKVWGSRADQISHALPTTHHRCNLDVWTLVQNHGDGHRSLVTPERVLSEYNEDLIFFLIIHWNGERAQCSITPFPYPFSVLLIALFIYYTSLPTGTEARTEVK